MASRHIPLKLKRIRLRRASSALTCSLVLAAAGCVEGEAPPPPLDERTCEDSERRILEISEEMIRELATPCEVDGDCDVVAIGAECPNGDRFGLPDEAIAFARFQEAFAFVAERADQVCLPQECSFPRFDNFYEYAFCDSGICRATTSSPDNLCPALANDVTAAANEIAQELPHPCDSDQDCFAFLPEWVCAEHELRAQGCAVVLSVGEDIDADLQAALTGLCLNRDFPCDVIDTACGELAPACVDSVCVNSEG